MARSADGQSQNKQSLTGVWHGMYTYVSQPEMPESHFVCVLIDSGVYLSGTVHETMQHFRGPPTETSAVVEGTHAESWVNFLKTYDGSGGSAHSVSYIGTLNDDRSEIEGDWHIHSPRGVFSGRFLMIRNRGQDASATTDIAAHVE